MKTVDLGAVNYRSNRFFWFSDSEAEKKKKKKKAKRVRGDSSSPDSPSDSDDSTVKRRRKADLVKKVNFVTWAYIKISPHK